MRKKLTLRQVLAIIFLVGLFATFILLGIFNSPWWFFVAFYMLVTLWAIDGNYKKSIFACLFGRRNFQALEDHFKK